VTRDDIAKLARELAREVGLHSPEIDGMVVELARFAARVAAIEREACAKIADNVASIYDGLYQVQEAGAADRVAELIRERGNTK